jgi:hypothetical protein
MVKLRYGGETQKYNNFTRKQLLELLKDQTIPNKIKLRRSELIDILEKGGY